MARTGIPVIPVLVGLGTLGVLYLTSQSSQATPPPSPGPGPSTDPQGVALLALAQQYVAQAAANPASVDPNALDALASQLQAYGYDQQAGLLRQTAIQLRGLPVPPGGPAIPPPVTMPPANTVPPLVARSNQLIEQARLQPLAVDLSAMEMLAPQLEAAGFTMEAAQLRAEAQRVRLLRIEGRGINFDPTVCTPNDTQLPAATVARLNALLAQPNPDPAALEQLASQIEVCGFLTQVTQLRQRAAQVRSQQRPFRR